MYAKLGLQEFARRVFDEMPVRDMPAWNSLLSGYAKAGMLQEALELFGWMPYKNVVSWTAMISGYSQNGQYENAVGMFLRMEQERDVGPNAVTIASVLPACANLGALELGERIEVYAKEKGYYLENLFVSNALLDMYARCGRIDQARRVFHEIGGKRNVCSWNSMIMGLAVHGKCQEALKFFHQMQKEGSAPDEVTFVAILVACMHGGLVSEGRELFKSMGGKYLVTPKLKHYGCMIDLLGRAGEVNEAYDLIQSMPMKPDSVVWGALLGACSFCGQVELAEIAAKSLFELEPWNPANYVILSNIYASAGRWEGVADLRKYVKGSQMRKEAGYSFLEEGGQIHKFIVGDMSHPRSDDIYAVLNEISSKMKLLANAMQQDEVDLFLFM